MEFKFVSSAPIGDACVIPFTAPAVYATSICPEADRAVSLALEAGFSGREGELQVLTLPCEGRLMHVVLVGLGSSPSPRCVHLSVAKALRRCKEQQTRDISMVLENAPVLLQDEALFEAACRLPTLVNYTNTGLKSGKAPVEFETIRLVAPSQMKPLLDEAIACAEGTVWARRLCNEPASMKTPASLARDVEWLGNTYGFDVEVFEQEAIEQMGMKSFLAVARGAHNTPPRLIVMRHLRGGTRPTLGLIGKGIVYDSGGYSLKTARGMVNMFDDCGGATAVIGAMTAIARQNLDVNVVGVVAACENKITHDAYLPGDIIGSMSGKTIEITNTDAEGRLTLADALTYAVQKEGCSVLVDIASLTSAAKAAVGRFSAAVLSNNDALFAAGQAAAHHSCEKIWRLDTDEEMRGCLNSHVADLRNTGGTEAGGGSMVAGLFIREFAEGRPWMHIDSANVNFRAVEPPAFSVRGATGYGAALLYFLTKELSKEHDTLPQLTQNGV